MICVRIMKWEFLTFNSRRVCIFGPLTKMTLLIFVYSSKVYQYEQFYGPKFTGENFASNSEV